MTHAVPQYLSSHLPKIEGLPPGHRFRLYFGGWWTKQLEQRRIDDLEKRSEHTANPRERDKLRQEVERRLRKLQATVSFSEIDDEKRKEELEAVARDAPSPGALVSRQLFVKGVSDACITAQSTAPFTTGLGIEHPLENGFAFLDPYGLPYLPGSAVKGVLRRAAEELALFETDSQGWSIPAIWWLFGFDSNSAFFARDGNDPQPILEERGRWRDGLRSHLERLRGGDLDLLDQYARLACSPTRGSSASAVERVCSWITNGGRAAQETREIHTRGALELWDVIPEPKDDKLRVDIMNPHYGHYYQHGQTPGDWGSPIPIFFLTLPPGTHFTFIVRFRPPINWPDTVRRHFEASDNGVPRWKSLVTAALAYAFDWLGFGAKTAVGYGRMQDPGLQKPPFPRLQAPRAPRGRNA